MNTVPKSCYCDSLMKRTDSTLCQSLQENVNDNSFSDYVKFIVQDFIVWTLNNTSSKHVSLQAIISVFPEFDNFKCWLYSWLLHISTHGIKGARSQWGSKKSAPIRTGNVCFSCSLFSTLKRTPNTVLSTHWSAARENTDEKNIFTLQSKETLKGDRSSYS